MEISEMSERIQEMITRDPLGARKRFGHGRYSAGISAAFATQRFEPKGIVIPE
jgi:hypothetical protein